MSVCPGVTCVLLGLTFWHSVNVHIKAQDEATQSIGHAWPHHCHCKQDPCNTKPRLGHLSFPLQVGACPMGKSSLSSLVGPGQPSRTALDLYWPHGTEARDSCPATPSLRASYPPTQTWFPPQTPKGGTSPHQGRGVSCCCGQSRRYRRCQRAGWAHRPPRAESVL